ncbi:MAG: hypothetical protein NTAFB01_41900 [Nitrospira sp.]
MRAVGEHSKVHGIGRADSLGVQPAHLCDLRRTAFTGLTDLNQQGMLDNSLLRHRIETEIERELRQKGLLQARLDQNPDLLGGVVGRVKGAPRLELHRAVRSEVNEG